MAFDNNTLPASSVVLTIDGSDDHSSGYFTVKNAHLQYLLNFVEGELGLLNARNWDNYGAYPIGTEVIENCTALLKSLPQRFLAMIDTDEICPNPNGTISIDWIQANICLSLEIGAQRSAFFVKKMDVLLATNEQFLPQDHTQQKYFLEILHQYFPNT